MAREGAIGAPYENDGARGDAGAVHAIHGSAGGLTAAGSSAWSQASTGVADHPGTGDGFGSAGGR